MRIIVGGSRSCTNKKLVWSKLTKLTIKLDDFEIVTGACPDGADKLAEDWAYAYGITTVRYHADWDKHKKAAGPIRNSEMVKQSGAKAAIFFYDGNSPGTKDCIQKCKKAGLKVRVIRF